MNSMKKSVSLVFFLLVLFAIPLSVDARRIENFSAEDAYDWILTQADDGSYNNDVIDTSVALLALDAAGGIPSQEANWLINHMNPQNCWPESGCTVKDTAFAMLALYLVGKEEEARKAEAWLKKGQTPSLTQGNWWLQVDTASSGTCKVTYTRGEKEVSKDIKVEVGNFPDCGGGTFFDLEKCLETGLLNNYASLELYVDCSGLDGAKIAIAYFSGTAYYLYEEVAEKVGTLTVKNGCFGKGYKDKTCSYDSTLYAEWALSKIQSKVSSELYLQDSYEPTNSIHNAVLYILTKDADYSSTLVAKQRTDGSWEGNPYSTALSILSLKESGIYVQQIEKAEEWLKDRQQEDGSWSGKILDTAMVLYAAFHDGISLPSCVDSKKNQGERGIDCGGPCGLLPYDDDCCANAVRDENEDGVDCGGVCGPCLEKVCDEDGICDEVAGEDCQNCPDDCQTCDDLCSNGKMDTASAEEGIDCGGLCPIDCSEIVCVVNNKCEYNLLDLYPDASDNEDSQNCPADCTCGDDICDDYEREQAEIGKNVCPEDCPSVDAVCGNGICESGEDETCPEDCEEEGCNFDNVCDLNEDVSCPDCEEEEGRGVFGWLILIFIILVIGGGLVYFFFLRPKKGKGEKPSYPSFGVSRGFGSRPPEKPKGKGSFFSLGKPLTPSRPAAPARPYFRPKETKSKLDEEIDKSIKEAKKLLGKKED